MDESFSPVPEASPYEPPDPLWGLVEKFTPPHEREEIKRMLGGDLVEQSLELHQEVNLLLEIWRDYRDETEDLMSKSIPRLPEPPAARDRLKQEIKFFVESIREKSKEHGREPLEALSNSSTNVIQYALDERCSSSGYGSRPSTARSSQGRETPMLSDRCRSTMISTLSDEVEAINDKLTYLKFDQVVAHLRETLESEVIQLRQDTEFLQKCLDDEVDFRSQSREGMREPSLADLSVERSKLEKELLKPQSPVPIAMRENNNKPSRLKSIPSSIGPQSIPTTGRPVPPSTPKNSHSSRRTPIKASHDIPITRATSERTRETSERTHDCHLRTASSSQTTSQNKHSVQTHNVQQRSSSAKHISGSKFKMQDTIKHITIRTNQPITRVAEMNQPITRVAEMNQPITHVAETNSNSNMDDLSEINLAESPEPSAKPSRPTSASRFRRMVQQCRD